MGDTPLPKCINLLRQSTEETQQFLKSFDTVVIVCEGVIWYLLEQIPNAGKALQELEHHGKKLKFLSNNSMYTDEEYIAKLASMGVNGVKADDILHPVKSLSRYLRQNHINKPIYSLCSKPVNEVLKAQGFDIQFLRQTKEIKESELLTTIKTTDDLEWVMLDLNFNVTYCQLAKAHRYLENTHCQLLVGAEDPFVCLAKNCSTIGTQGFVNMLFRTSNITPIVVGKPGPFHMTHLLEQFKINDPTRVILFAESLKMDVPFGRSAGFKTLLFMSGTATPQAIVDCPERDRPDYMSHSVADFLRFYGKS